MTAGITKLHTLLGSYPNAMAIKNGAVKSDLINFEFADVKVSNTAFKPLVREAKFDVGELAIVTFLQAKVYGKPYVIIPATVLGRGQHHTIAYNPEQVHWVTFEDPHLAEYKDPEFVTRAPESKTLTQMLFDGEIDAAIVGDKLPDPRLAPLIPDADAAGRKWAQTHGGIPINHMMVVRDTIAKSRPDIVREIYRMLQESRRAVSPPSDGSALDPWRFGIEGNRRSLEIVIDYSFRQKLIPRKLSVDELFDDCTRGLT